MKQNNNSVIIILVLIIGYLIFFHKQKYEGFTAQEWYEEYSYTENKLEETQDNLSEYKDALDQANSNIDDAKYYAWESYEEMGNALDNLESVNP